MAAEGERILELRGVSKRFGAVQALSQVDFECDRGEVVALVGDNGAGKSTLVKAIAGVQPPDEGEFLFEGAPVEIPTPDEARALGIATVYQDLALCENLDVAANLFLGSEVTRRVGAWSGLLDSVSMEQRAIQLLASLSVSLPQVQTRVVSLSGGQRQTVAIARALIGEPKLVLLDEPTAALGVAQSAEVLRLIGRLAEAGLGVIVVSHNLADVLSVSDRVVVLRLGRRVGSFVTRDTSKEQLVAAITGAEFGVSPPRR